MKTNQNLESAKESKIKAVLAVLAFILLALIVFGLIWAFWLGPATPVGIGWYLFSFAAGLTMIVLPCTLPLAFVIVPLSLGKGAAKGLGIALSFGLGVAIMLSMYGILAAVLGGVIIQTLGGTLETVKNWLYLIAGATAFLFSLGALGLVRYRMPSYTGAAPAFIQKQQDYLKAFLLGLFLGNIGVGCPHPATPVIFTRIATSGSVFYGWLLFFVHALGRVLPLLLLSFLGILGVNALSWLVKRKDKIERATGWMMVFVAAFILVLGLFTHDWWVASGQHTLFEEITQEERFLRTLASRLNAEPPHTHGFPSGTGLFGLPLWFGDWILVFLWIVPMWWYHFKKEREENKKNNKRFGFLTILSLLLIFVFVFYLPLRFKSQVLGKEMRERPHQETQTMLMPEDMVHSDKESGHTGENILYHEEEEIKEGLAINFKVAPIPALVGAETRLDFLVNEKPSGAPVTGLDLDHGKFIHILGVRDDLNEFFHLHPKNTGEGFWSVNYQFNKPGRYKIFSNVRKNGGEHTFGHPYFIVEGEGATSEKEISLGKTASVDSYRVTLDYKEPISAGAPTSILVSVKNAAGEDVVLDNYLGAKLHLAVIKEDLTNFIHTHPEEWMSNDHSGSIRIFKEVLAHGAEEDGMENMEMEIPGKEGRYEFKVIFPKPGIYRLFAQFRPAGSILPEDEALTAGFFVKTEEVKISFAESRWTYFLTSLVLLLLLSMGVQRYLSVDKN